MGLLGLMAAGAVGGGAEAYSGILDQRAEDQKEKKAAELKNTRDRNLERLKQENRIKLAEKKSELRGKEDPVYVINFKTGEGLVLSSDQKIPENYRKTSKSVYEDVVGPEDKSYGWVTDKYGNRVWRSRTPGMVSYDDESKDDVGTIDKKRMNNAAVEYLVSATGKDNPKDKVFDGEKGKAEAQRIANTANRFLEGTDLPQFRVVFTGGWGNNNYQIFRGGEAEQKKEDTTPTGEITAPDQLMQVLIDTPKDKRLSVNEQLKKQYPGLYKEALKKLQPGRSKAEKEKDSKKSGSYNEKDVQLAVDIYNNHRTKEEKEKYINGLIKSNKELAKAVQKRVGKQIDPKAPKNEGMLIPNYNRYYTSDPEEIKKKIQTFIDAGKTAKQAMNEIGIPALATLQDIFLEQPLKAIWGTSSAFMDWLIGQQKETIKEGRSQYQ